MNENVNASIAMNADYERACKLSERALADCRTSLMMAYRFMDIALWKMPFSPVNTRRALATDGRIIAYDPLTVLKRYRDSSTELTRDMLHSIIHCIFRQPFDRTHSDKRAWMLACDIVTEAIAMEMAAKRFPSALDEQRADAIGRLRRASNTLTPSKLYALLSNANDGAEGAQDIVDKAFASKLRTLFTRDDHLIWPAYAHDDEADDTLGQALSVLTGFHATASTDENSADDLQRKSDALEAGIVEAAEGEADDLSDLADKLAQLVADPDDADPDDDRREEQGMPDRDEDDEFDFDDLSDLDAEWLEISKLMETDLLTYAQEWGEGAGHLMANLAVSNRNRIDYRDFLRRFCAPGEDIKINDDEFDYIFYTYGLKLFDNMPLVEPLEYQEAYRVREFAIAIDTSGSCQGDLVQTFLNTTYEILSNSEGFGEKVNIHIIQCDAGIQSDVKIESLAEIEEYKDNLKVRGFGGTDFRPVFEYVDKLVFEGEFTNLKGLIYFTDGYGTFPGKRPAYDTAFVFVEEDGANRRVPPWAMKVVIDKETIRTMA